MRTRLLAGALALTATATAAQNFGGAEDQDYAAQLWQAMVDAGLAGEDAIAAAPHPGTSPHGAMLETFYTRATIGDHQGALMVKRNYGPEDVTADEILGDPAAHLASTTIMFRRAEGYDPETGNWFYAKYLPDGSLEQNPAGTPLAGLVGKGGDAGCLPCHSNAPGDDYLYTTDAALDGE